MALISNIDGDHAWNEDAIVLQERQFRIFAGSFKKTLYVASAETCRILSRIPGAEAVAEDKFQYLSSLAPENMLGYERSNAALALAGAEYLGCDVLQAAEALKSYPGIKRRQMVTAVSGDQQMTVLEDYAHHPKELACSLEVLKMRYPEHELQVVFQPHRYRRLQYYFKDFVRILSDNALSVKVLPVFCAWEQTLIDGMESSDLVNAINASGGNAELLNMINPAQTAIRLIEQFSGTEKPVLIALIGAGDIDRLAKALAFAVSK